jgi:hypothetical protein
VGSGGLSRQVGTVGMENRADGPSKGLGMYQNSTGNRHRVA